MTLVWESGITLQHPDNNDPLLDLNTQPSLDLQFATSKTLDDAVSGTNLITFSRASSGTYVDSDGLIKTAVTDAPRFDHDPVTGESLGLLIEESRTNLVEYSEQLGNWGTPSTAIGNTTTSPSGGTAVGVDSTTSLTITVTDPSSITFSCYVKAGSSDYVYLRTVNWGTLVRVWFNLADGSTGSVSPVSSNITNVTSTDAGDGWYRISFQLDSTGDNVGNLQITATDADLNINQVGYVFAWGIQVEEGSFPTSYIPTTTSAVTRAADVVEITGTNFSSWFNPSEGTIYSKAIGSPQTTTTTNTGSGYPYIYSIDSSLSNRLIGSRSAGVNNGSWAAYAQPPASFSYVTSSNFNTQQVSHKVGGSYTSSTYVAFADGVVGSSITPGTNNSALLRLSIGSGIDGGFWGGHIARLAYFPTRKTDQELIDLTT